MSDEQKKEQDTPSTEEKSVPEVKETKEEVKATPEEKVNSAEKKADESTESKEEAPAEGGEAEAEAPGKPVEDEEKIAEEEEARKKQEEEEKLAAEETKASDLRPGMTIRLHQTINEGEKSRVQVFQGIIIALRGKTPETKTVTLQKKSFGVMVEKIFPLASPLIEKIEVVKIAKVRRSKLYYLRDYGKRLKETLVKK